MALFHSTLNALVFRCFGVSFAALFTVDLVLTAGLTALLYTGFSRILDRLTAFACGALFLMVFAFSQLGSTGNYNFVSPYSHEATHGILLSAVMILLLWHFGRHRRYPWLALAGGVLGCICMTRAEVAVAAAAYTVCFLWLNMREDFAGPRRLLKHLLWLAGGFAMPLTVAVILFRGTMDFVGAFHAVGGAWTTLAGSTVAANPFFLTGLGFDRPLENAANMAGGALAATALTALVVWLLRWSAAGTAAGRRAITFALLALILVLTGRLDPYEAARPLPLLVLVILLTASLAYRKTAPEAFENRRKLSFFISFLIFSSVLLLKMILNCRLFHYGFYLALPATLACAVFLVWYLPGFTLRISESRRPASVIALAAILVFGVLYVRASRQIYDLRDYPVGTGADRIVTFGPRYDARGMIVRATLEWIGEQTAPGATFAALPEGIMINYLARRPSPSAYTTFMMTEVLAFGESTILADLRADSPDYILLVHKDTSEFGVGFFGEDPSYGMEIMKWIRLNYRPAVLHGREPMTNDRFGIRILQRRDQ